MFMDIKDNSKDKNLEDISKKLFSIIKEDNKSSTSYTNLNVRIKKNIKNKLEKICAKENISLSKFIEKFLILLLEIDDN